jgi:hypothetical protein
VPQYKSIAGSKPVIILGMHRSGTSCLAGSLEQAGLYLGQVNTKAPHNAKGNRENRDIMDLNDAVLSAAGGSWDNPPDSTVHWPAEQIVARNALIATYPTDSAWGFKEPRTLLTLNGWLDALPKARLVGTFRHPMAVAQSLNTRNGMSIERGMDLWLPYNRLLLQVCQEHEVLMVCFDWSPQRYSRALAELAKRLSLTLPSSGFDFFEAALQRNSVIQNDELPPKVHDLYLAMKVMTRQD